MNMRLRARFSVAGTEVAEEQRQKIRCGMHKPLIPTMTSKERAGTGWVKAATITSQSKCSP